MYPAFKQVIARGWVSQVNDSAEYREYLIKTIQTYQLKVAQIDAEKQHRFKS